MRCWFLSYNSRDLQVACAFEAELKRKDSDATILTRLGGGEGRGGPRPRSRDGTPTPRAREGPTHLR
jgi:hypothetical protein